ncbi:sarcosine oxidase subunit gamma [Nocardiopsis xinjiangensis]|uniref:sarcosine oxidase subunit gamma n=1 Tax=Nocardiopsis xinjiangensis TaxID=124285 RepID=UPI000345F5B6|nr:sarcosine oxidase subunit gamma family protein [Nocardiopsis xinjiangensis]
MAEIRGESPLAPRAKLLAEASVPDVLELGEIPFLTQVALRLDPEGAEAARVGAALGAPLPLAPGTSVVAGDLLVLWMGPDEWLVMGEQGRAPEVVSALTRSLEGEHGAVVDVSGQRTTLEVAGPRAEEFLNKGCPLDLHPFSFGPGRCAQTLLARTEVALLRRHGTTPVFWVLVRSSFARHLAGWAADAAAEYGARDTLA